MNSTYADLDDAVAAPEQLSAGYAWDAKEDGYRAIAPRSVRGSAVLGAYLRLSTTWRNGCDVY